MIFILMRIIIAKKIFVRKNTRIYHWLFTHTKENFYKVHLAHLENFLDDY